MRSSSGVGAVIVVLLLVATGCGGGAAEGSGTYREGGTFTFTLPSDPGNLDPYHTVLSVATQFNDFTYDTLVSQAPDGEIIPSLAETWETTPTSVTYTLREGITCADGTELSASHVAANLTYLQDPENASPLLGVYLPSPDYTVAADDAARTVTITMAQPYGFLLLGAGSLPIVCPSGMADRDTLTRGSAGTGPYTLVEAVPGDHYLLEVREDYTWGPGGDTTAAPGVPETVVIRIVENESTRANLVLSGGADVAMVTGPDRERLAAAGLFQRAATRSFGQLVFNQQPRKPGGDQAVQEALTMALDLDGLAKVATTGGTGRRATGLVAIEPKPCEGNSVKGNLPPHDPAAAARVLEEAGWTPGPDGVRTKDGRPLRVDLHYLTEMGAATAGAVELAARTWEELGVDVRLTPDTSTALSETLFGTGNWDAYWFSINVSFPSMLVGFYSGPPAPEGQNFGAVENAEYTELVGQAMATPGDEGCALWQQAEAALVGNLDVVPVVDEVVPYFGNKTSFEITSGQLVPTSVRLLDR